MIRTLLATGASALALGFATPALADDHTDANMAEEANELPTMSFGEWGFDPAALSPEVDPGDDFFA